ncbi:3-oxoacyl-ACP synthase [Mucilaginibacter terrigena]|uniref:3-oxoacyl-ACP synthase n=1 Tax=Mucilaginibacter terrigena TaxID=2492395 RepID=A0A4Q5LH54_9SPHI|nr:3-oxoacyl-ACP synthase [Mucilaginibacter terrigena]RYU86212.1 3-oxoacyl-ACP synthase [Mucilaginibacter terrigena]
MSDIKAKLHALCVTYVKTRMHAAEQAIAEARQAQNDDTKSSAGDKYETGREMAQQETNRNLTQLNEANKLMVALNQVSFNGTSSKAETGSVILTNNGNFYLAISAGTLTLDGKNYFAVSPASPIGFKLKDKRPGDEFILNEKTYQIQSIL